MHKDILTQVDKYYSDKIQMYGAVPKGVDWNGEESQTIRFKQLSQIINDEGTLTSILDYGCGYGAFYDFIHQIISKNFQYVGYDISQAMIKEAMNKHQTSSDALWLTEKRDITPCDFTVASGIFNVKQDIDTATWEKYVFDSLQEINHLSKKGFAVNLLTSYSEDEKKRDYLYYADPCKIFDFCKRNFSKTVALCHDYPLYEFTILVRKGLI